MVVGLDCWTEKAPRLNPQIQCSSCPFSSRLARSARVRATQTRDPSPGAEPQDLVELITQAAASVQTTGPRARGHGIAS